MTRNIVFAISLAALASVAMLGSHAQATPEKENLLLCYLDGKKNSLGAVVTIDHKSYRCTSVLAERGVPGTAWVQVKMTPVIVGD